MILAKKSTLLVLGINPSKFCRPTAYPICLIYASVSCLIALHLGSVKIPTLFRKLVFSYVGDQTVSGSGGTCFDISSGDLRIFK